MIVRGNRRAVRWTAGGKASFLPALPGHTWTDAFGINDDGVVSGWSRKLPNDDGEENPVLWDASGKVTPLKTAPDAPTALPRPRIDSGLTVGYLGNAGTDGIPGVPNTDPERDNAVVWQSRTAKPRLLGRPLRCTSSPSSSTSTTTARPPAWPAPDEEGLRSRRGRRSGGPAGRP